MNTQLNDLGRLDRVIVENLQDIRSCFDADAGIVLDFIVFITQRMKTDLFGFTRFSLKEFCAVTGRHRQDLAQKHPLFSFGGKSPPEIEGFRFESVFDYCLILMMQRNLIFSNVFQSKQGNKVVQLESIRLLSDVKVNFARKGNELKIYDVRLSPELINGFICRYYTIDVSAYRTAGKGKGKESRQALVVYLSMLRHIMLSRSESHTRIPMHSLIRRANIPSGKRAFHQREALGNILKWLKSKTSFSFDFRFEQDPVSQSYFVEIDFPVQPDKKALLLEHRFYSALLEMLSSFFTSTLQGKPSPRDDPRKTEFQFWLGSPHYKTEKAAMLRQCYEQVYGVPLSESEAFRWIELGLFKA